MLVPDANTMKAMHVALGICPYCHRTLSDERTNGERIWRHCFSCHFDFYIEETPNEENQG